MIRIEVEWDFVSPYLKTALGMLTINDFDADYNMTKLLQCKVEVKRGQLGFRSITDKGYPCSIFDEYKEKIESVVKSYFLGMCLEKTIYEWVEDK